MCLGPDAKTELLKSTALFAGYTKSELRELARATDEIEELGRKARELATGDDVYMQALRRGMQGKNLARS